MTAVAAGVCIAALGLGMPGTSTAEPGGAYQPPAKTDPTLVAMDQVREVAERMAGLYHSAGFGYTALNFDTRVVTLYFKGKPPTAALAAQVPNTNGVRVAITPIPYSETEMRQKEQALADANRAAGGPSINMIGRRPDYSGLVAYVDAAQLATASSLSSKYAIWSGVPVDVAQGSGLEFQTRANDSPPWQGGGQLRFPGTQANNFCTSGFAVLDNETGTGRMLTAGHCKLNFPSETEAVTRVNDGAGQLIAWNSDIQYAPNYDSLLIDPVDSPATIGKVFAGPWDAGTGNARYQLHVGGSAAPSQGDRVCVSGANSGEHTFVNGDCNRIISQLNVGFDCPNTTTLCHGFLYGGSGVTSTGGDSGAPVYVMRADGRVGARGIHDGGVVATTCPTDTAGFEAGSCSTTSMAIPINEIEDRWTVHVEFD
jgi:hypothetical protein